MSHVVTVDDYLQELDETFQEEYDEGIAPSVPEPGAN